MLEFSDLGENSGWRKDVNRVLFEVCAGFTDYRLPQVVKGGEAMRSSRKSVHLKLDTYKE